MSIIGGDWGSFETKLVTNQGAFSFSSYLGEWREFNMDRELEMDEITYEYKGKKGFAGRLAEDESRFRRLMAGESKAHEDALIRILIGIHLFTNDLEHDLIVGQPIKNHKAEKDRIAGMLKGKHTISVKGTTKSIYINNVAVAPEGAGAFWAYRGDESKIRIVDVGSGTINGASVNQGKFNDRDSFTLPYGANSEEIYNVENLADSIIATSTKKEWSKQDPVRVCGGLAEELATYLSKHFVDVKMIQPMIREGNRTMRKVHPVFANAAGFYELARDLYA